MQLWRLKERIENKTIKIGGYHKFMVFDPKKREIQALSFSDRVFQHLLCDKVLMPYFEPKLIYDNAACRKNKGTHFAQNRFTGFLRDHYKKYGSKGYILKYDVKGYFNSIHHKVLKEKLKNFPDKEIKELLYYIIDSYESEPERGIPMGNQSNQWFALYYLDRLDRTIKEKLHIKYYIRYMDDGVLLHQDKGYLKECLVVIKEQATKDKLEFNKKTEIFPLCQGVDFLGFHFYLNRYWKSHKKA